MMLRKISLSTAVALALSASAFGFLKLNGVGESMTGAATAFLGSLNDEQRTTAFNADYSSPARVKWHFIPLAERKGLQIKHMTPPQRTAALALLRTALSEAAMARPRRSWPSKAC